MIPGSSVPAVRVALFAQLTAAFSDEPGVMVSLDDPMGVIPDDVVAIGGVTSEVGFLAMIGDLDDGSLQETFTVTVVCQSYRGGDDAAGTFTAAAGMADTVISTVRSNPTLSGAVDVQCVPIAVEYVSSLSSDKAGTPNGRITEATVLIRCNSTL